MSKGWVAQVVSQTGCRNDAANLPNERFGQFRMAFQQYTAHPISQRASHTGNLKAMGKAIVHKDASRQGEHLRFILQAPERRRKDQTVIVTQEVRAVHVALAMVGLHTEALSRYQLSPIHDDYFLSFLYTILRPPTTYMVPGIISSTSRRRRPKRSYTPSRGAVTDGSRDGSSTPLSTSSNPFPR